MPFLNPQSHGKRMVDKVFKAAVKAKEDVALHGDLVVNATLGTLYDEDGNFVALDSVWTPFSTLTNVQKAKYAAGIQGNPNYRHAVKHWLFGTTAVPCEIVATPGGAGAVSSTMKNMLEPGQIVIKPSLAWGPYQTMATEFGLLTRDYNLFQGDRFDLDDFVQTCADVMSQQGKVLAILNDPCHNPSGYTMTTEEWDAVIEHLGTLAKQGPVILLHDIAYVDFSTNPDWKQGLSRYANLPSNMMVVIAFSLSKTFTAYGMRVGAAVAITPDTDQLTFFRDAMVYSARSIWSTVNNSIMDLFAIITGDSLLLTAYQNEKQHYIDLIRERADIFIQEAKACGLPLYPYKEGFFATIPMAKDQVEQMNLTLQEHHIFLVEVGTGLRVALCSVPKAKLKGLAKRIKDIIQ